MIANSCLAQLCALSEIPADNLSTVQMLGDDPIVKTPYRVSATGAASIAATGLAASRLWQLKTGRTQTVQVDAHHATAALRSAMYLRLNHEEPELPHDPVSGFYRLQDQRWMYLHCNVPTLLARNISVLGAEHSREDIASRVSKWDGVALEEAIMNGGGCAALVRHEVEWLQTEQAMAVESMPWFEIIQIGESDTEPLPAGDRPLSGIRVLDSTRVLAGPTAARTLAEHGADVLKISRPDLPNSGIFDFDTGLGKRSAFLDLRDAKQLAQLHELIRQGDVFSQSNRPQALANFGLTPQELAKLRPGIVYVTLSAWGHEGPWRHRRGFDSIVQAASGMTWRDTSRDPSFMPVSAQDYIAGYLMSFGAMVALHRRATQGGSWMVRVSLAGVGRWIRQLGLMSPDALAHCNGLTGSDVEQFKIDSASSIGLLSHLSPVVQMSETPARWTLPAVPLGTHEAKWLSR